MLTKKWQQYWSEGFDLENEEAVRCRDEKLLTIGNLTLLTDKLNTNISNTSWETKLSGRGSHKGLRTYASGIETLVDYLSHPAWDETTIEKRAADLLDKSIKTWPSA